MIDITWKIFSQTGNIETYLLLKELENDLNTSELQQNEHKDILSIDTKI